MYTMCPPGYYHNGFMATPELGHRIYGYIYIYIYIWLNYRIQGHTCRLVWLICSLVIHCQAKRATKYIHLQKWPCIV